MNFHLTQLSFTSDDNLDINLFINNVKSLFKLYKNTKENQPDYAFTSEAYIITHGLFTAELSEIDFDKKREVILRCTQPLCDFKCKEKADRFQSLNDAFHYKHKHQDIVYSFKNEKNLNKQICKLLIYINHKWINNNNIKCENN